MRQKESWQRQPNSQLWNETVGSRHAAHFLLLYATGVMLVASEHELCQHHNPTRENCQRYFRNNVLCRDWLSIVGREEWAAEPDQSFVEKASLLFTGAAAKTCVMLCSPIHEHPKRRLFIPDTIMKQIKEC